MGSIAWALRIGPSRLEQQNGKRNWLSLILHPLFFFSPGQFSFNSFPRGRKKRFLLKFSLADCEWSCASFGVKGAKEHVRMSRPSFSLCFPQRTLHSVPCSQFREIPQEAIMTGRLWSLFRGRNAGLQNGKEKKKQRKIHPRCLCYHFPQ